MISKKFTQEEQQELEKIIADISNANAEIRMRAARELARLGIWKRESIRPRGSLNSAASSRLPNPKQLRVLLNAFAGERSSHVRSQLALALAEWGDGSACAAIAVELQSLPEGSAGLDESVWLALIVVLRTIGGPEAVRGLASSLEEGNNNIRNAAVMAIEELATGGRYEDSERNEVLSKTDDTPSGRIWRGSSGIHVLGVQEAGETRILSALEKVRNDADSPDFVRAQIADIIGFLV